MRSGYLLFVFSLVFILLNSGHAFDVEINGQMYRLSPVTKYAGTVGDSTYYAEWHVIAAQPWYGNESLAESLKNQVGPALTTNGEVPGFVYRRNGPSLYFYYYPYNAAYGGLAYFVKATLLIDTDGDGSYDLDDLDDDNDGLTDAEELNYGTDSLLADSDGNGINDIHYAFQLIKAQKVELEAQVTSLNSEKSYLEAERDSRPTQNSFDLVVAERDARPTQAALDAMIAERDARPTQAALDAMIAERDARPTQANYDAVVVDRDAIVAERDAKPTQASYDAMVAERDAKIEQFSALDSRVNEILPKAVPNTPSFDLDNFNISFNLGKNLLEQSKDYQIIHNYYGYAEWKIGQVESRIAEGEYEEAVIDMDDLIEEVTSSPLTYEVPYNFSQVREKFENSKSKLVSFNVLNNAYDPTPVPTATLEEYITSLNSDLTSAREERDNKLSMEEVRDMKLKSRMMQVDGGSASLNITLEATDNLGITSPTWSPIPETKVVIHPEFQNGKIRIDIDGDDDTNSGTKFYRFKMND